MNGVRRDHQVQLRGAEPRAVGNQLAALNQALSQIEEDENGGTLPAPSYPVESIETKKESGGKDGQETVLCRTIVQPVDQ